MAYALPSAVLQPLLPPGIVPDTYGELGFLAIALVETCDLRPAFLPAGWGMNFFSSGYRVFSRYKTPAGRTLRGLYIVRSNTNRRMMQIFGNVLTHYRYQYSDCRIRRTDRLYEVQVKTSDNIADLHVEADLSAQGAALPQGSPFPTLTEARKFAGPLPFTFDYEKQTRSIIRVEGVRQQWNPRPVSVIVRQNSFIEQEPFRCARVVLANAFFLENVAYAWRAGVREALS